MPCFIRQIRRQRIKVPNNLSLLNPEDAERIEEELKSRLSVETHEELQEKIEEFSQLGREKELRKIIEEALDKLSEEKEQSEGPPDRFKEQRRKWKEMQLRAVAH
ncbi:MAG: hypothetical protein ACE5Z5_11010 [Candidatus Bathyarchaeia archaeon]